ncbi:hypothetical protein HOC35_05270 [Candidatus Woesearchaeota archaeon]|nr:hypothetical protein [Candidatus Woesearchaeota archaeon]
MWDKGIIDRKMQEELIDLLRATMFSDGVMARFSKSSDFLRGHGFDFLHDTKDIKGKKVAINLGTFHCDFIEYSVDDVIEHSDGSEIITSDDVRFYQNPTNNLRLVRRSSDDLDLFLPKYLLNFGIFVGDNFSNADEDISGKIGWKYPPKRYLTEAQIRKQHKDIYKNIVKWLDSKRLDLSVHYNLLKSIAEDLGIEVEIESRHKTVEGVYSNLMRMPGVRSLPGLWDINGHRVICQTSNDCYKMLSKCNDGYFPFGKVRDIVAVPKPNCFQGIIAQHVDQDLSLEIQFQTSKMKQTADTVAGNYRS